VCTSVGRLPRVCTCVGVAPVCTCVGGAGPRGMYLRRGGPRGCTDMGGPPTAAVTEVMEFYVSSFNSALGKVSNVDVAAMEAGARAIFKKHGVAQRWSTR